VALEMAQQLTTQGREVAFLAVVDHTPPPLRFHGFDWTRRAVVEFILNFPCWLRDDLFRPRSGSPLGGIRQNVRAGLRRLRGLRRNLAIKSGQTDLEELFDASQLPEPLRKLMATHYQALREYVPRVYPGRVTLFRARTPSLFRLHGRDLGWSNLAGKGLDVVEIPGNHVTILQKPHVQVLAERLMGHLRNAQAASGRLQRLASVS
jgi:thioesterase domain-containing protein